ncbi:MAG: hypothetical protein HFI87_06720 [Bacilli bacterium]|nr:hypothetical protein [Bacilli bacterium]
MTKILGEINGNYYSLTIDGKNELVEEVNSRRFYNRNKKYDDDNFSSILEFIIRNFDNHLETALGENVKPNAIPLDRHLRISENRKKLEAWFEAVASYCNREDLTGDDILSYFCSEEYQQGIINNEFVANINGMTEILKRNIGLDNKEFLDKIKSINPRPMKR